MRRVAVVFAAVILTASGGALARQTSDDSGENRPQLQQINPDLVERAQNLDIDRLRLPDQLQIRPGQVEEPDFNSGAGYRLNPGNGLWYGWTNFDQNRSLGRIAGEDVSLAWREQAGGVRFAAGQREGARIIACGRGSNTCALPQPDSPDALIAGAGSGYVRIDFAQPVSAVSVLAAPDRGFGAEPDLFILEGWSDGDVAATDQQIVQIYDSAGQGWTRLTLSGLPGRVDEQDDAASRAVTAARQGREFDYVILRGVTDNGSPAETPIVIDSLRFADRYGPTPYDSLGPRAGSMASMVEDSGVRSRRLQISSQAEVIRERGARDGMRYPAAERMRMPLDMDGARTAALRQRRDMQMELPPASGLVGREPVTLPILAPLGVFTGEDPSAGLAPGVRFSGRSDYFHLRFNSEIGRVVISGTRVVTPGDRPGGPSERLAVSSGYDGAYASFNLYGGAYSVRVACGVEELDEPCNDPEALRTLLDRLFVWMPEGVEP